MNDIVGQRYSSTGAVNGTEFQINTYTTGPQFVPLVSARTDGGFVVVWGSGHDGSGNGVFGRLYSSTGVALGTDFQINTYTPGLQANHSMGMRGDGVFVVVWTDQQTGTVVGRRFSSTGIGIGIEFQVNTHTNVAENDSSLAILADGGFVVVWSSSRDGDFHGIFGQRYSSSGASVGSEFQVNSYTIDSQDFPEVAGGGDGSFVVVWRDQGSQDGDGTGVFAQRFTSTGAPAGTEFQVNAYTRGFQESPRVSAAADGSFVVVWYDFEARAFGRRFDSTGMPPGGDFPTSSGKHPQTFPSVAAAPSGGFLIAWESLADQDGDGSGVFARRYEEPGCGVAPMPGCSAAPKNRLLLKNDPNDKADKMVWKWLKGNETLLNFGNPLGDPAGITEYQLCIYDSGGFVLGGLTPAARGWVPIGSAGLKYKDGLAKMILKAGTVGKAKIIAKAKGHDVDMPASLGITPPVTVQLLNAQNGQCWESVFSSPPIQNDGSQFKAKVG
jgi:hypothetical protein